MNNDHIKKHRADMNARISKSYSNDIQKGGEGSKGGKVIGHTQSGKPIYDTHSSSHKEYKGFSKNDHYDAAIIHHHASRDNKIPLDRSLEMRGSGYYDHKSKAEEHINAMKHKDYSSIEQLAKEFFKKDKKTGLYAPQEKVIKQFSEQAKKHGWDDWSNLKKD